MSLFRQAVLALLLLSGVGHVAAQEFPQVFEHRYGTTTLETRPERVVTLTFSGQDHFLAVGVAPVGTRDWYGDFPYAAWPWAQDELGDAKPLLLSDINYEQIAALEPDVIEGLGSGMTAEQYVELSKIAPTIAAEAQYTNYSTPWAVRAQTIGRIVGKEAEAKALVDALKQRFADVAAAHPQWGDMEAAIAFNVTEFGAYRSIDTRAQIIGQLGFKTPAALDAAGAADAFWVPLSEEQMPLIDADLIVWIIGDGNPARIAGLPMRQRLEAVQQGREVVADFLVSGALSFASPLSLNFMLDHMVPLIELATDGDPATVVPSTADAGLLN